MINAKTVERYTWFGSAEHIKLRMESIIKGQTGRAMTKDWKGNGKSAFITIGASNHTGKEREAHDFYATDRIAIDKLVRNFELPRKIWECACGTGCLSERLVECGYDVVSTDIIDRGYGGVQDFLKADKLPDGCECILTNPPYKYALEFVQHSLDLLPDGGLCVMFLKTTFLEGQKRYDRLYKTMPPKTILQFSKRVLCAKNGKFAEMRSGGGSAVSYAWFVWEKGFVGDTIVRWI